MWPTFLSLWLTLSRPARRKAAARRPACPPVFERLEDRTTPSTVRLTPDNFAGEPGYLTPVGSTLYFLADAGNGNQLWRTNGRPGDAVAVDHGANAIATDPVGNPVGLAQVGTWLYFVTDNGPDAQGVDTYTLWRNDSAASPTSPSQSLQTFPGEAVIVGGGAEPLPFGPYQLAVVGHDLYFGARSTDGVWDLWKTTGADGASPSTAPFLYPGFQAYSSYNSDTPWGLQAAGSELYFAADYVHDGSTDYVLWGSDGTPGGTAPVQDSSGAFFPQGFDDSAAVGSDLYGIRNGNLWRFSGQVATEVQSNVGSGTPNYLFRSGYNMTAVGDSLYFTTFNSDGSYDLWKVTDTDPSATPVLVYQTPYAFTDPEQIVSAGPYVYVLDFEEPASPRDASHLWQTDGTPGGTQILKTFNIASGITNHTAISGWLTAAGSAVYFRGSDGKLWQSLGSSASTRVSVFRVGRLNSGSGSRRRPTARLRS